jgi:hypothetical protein
VQYGKQNTNEIQDFISFVQEANGDVTLYNPKGN